MRDSSKVFLNYFLFSLVTLLLTCLQVSLWPNYFGNFPAPHIWLPTLTYWCLYRNIKEAIIMTYLISFMLAPLTGMPLGLFIFTNVLMIICALLIKLKFYQNGPFYYALNVGIMTFCFVPLYLLSSFLLDSSFFRFNVEFGDWIAKILLTTLFSLPLHLIYLFIDRYTEKELPTETGRGIA